MGAGRVNMRVPRVTEPSKTRLRKASGSVVSMRTRPAPPSELLAAVCEPFPPPVGATNRMAPPLPSPPMPGLPSGPAAPDPPISGTMSTLP